MRIASRMLLGMLLLSGCVTAPEASGPAPLVATDAPPADGGGMRKAAPAPEALRVDHRRCKPGVKRDDGRTGTPQAEVGLARDGGAPYPYARYGCEGD